MFLFSPLIFLHLSLVCASMVYSEL